MKKIVFLLGICCLAFLLGCLNLYAEELTVIDAGSEQVVETISDKTQECVEEAIINVKSVSQNMAESMKKQSKIVADKTVVHTKSGAVKVKKATIKGANKFSNFAAKGIKNTAEKIQNSADKTIERTDKALENTNANCKCNCTCPECRCTKENN